MSRSDYPTSVRLPRDLREILLDRAGVERRSLSWIIIDVLRRWVEWDKTRYQQGLRQEKKKVASHD